MNFIEYIENLAERHVDIRDKADGHVHFLSSERAKHTSIDSVLHYPAVLVDRGSGFDYGGSPGQYTKVREYLLFIVEHVSDTSDYEEIDHALAHCEAILDSFLNQLIEDRKFRKIRLSFSLEQVEVEYIANHDNSQYGVMASVLINEPYKPLNCDTQFLLNRSFDKSFDKTFQ